MLGRHSRGPLLDSRALHLDGATAFAAHQVVMMAGAADPIGELAVISTQHVDLALGRHRLQVPIDRGEPHGRPGLVQAGVDLLRRGELGGAAGSPEGARSMSGVGAISSARSVGSSVARASLSERSAWPACSSQ